MSAGCEANKSPQPSFTFALQDLDGAEICCGHGRLSRCLRFAGYKVAGLDILSWAPYSKSRKLRTRTNPLDMLTPAGFAFLVPFLSWVDMLVRDGYTFIVD